MANTRKQKDTPLEAKIRVGQNVRRLRARRDLTLKQLSDLLAENDHPIGIATLSKIELGEREITVAHLEALARALGVTTDKLLAHSDMDALVRVQRLVVQMGALDSDIFALEQEMYDKAARLRDLRDHLTQFEAMLRDEIEQDGDLIDQLEGPGAVRAMQVARAILDGEATPMEASRRLA